MYVHERHACTWLRTGAQRVLFPTDYNLWHARLFCLCLSGIPLPLVLCATRPRLVHEAAARLPPRCALKRYVGMCFCLSFPAVAHAPLPFNVHWVSLRRRPN
ncbi:hypothetical protein TRVL_08816 [Trypanosoma vivax]|nr:hypothetical protein TRVL_08816 [Trypanosoma vivax]